MNVLDASVVTDALVSTGPAGQQARTLLAQESRLHVPALLGAEVTSALRAMLRRGLVDDTTTLAATRQVARLQTRQYPFEPLMERV